MRPVGIFLTILVLAGCKDDESEAPQIPTRVMIESVQVDVMPMSDSGGLPWDRNDGPDVFVSIYDKNSNVVNDTRAHSVNNIGLQSLPLHINVSTSFSMNTDSCYIVLWDRDDDAGDADDLIASANEWVSASRLRQAGNPRSIQMRNPSGDLRLVVFVLYQ